MGELALEEMPEEFDALVGALETERARAIAGVEPEPTLSHIFSSRSRAAHRATAAALREAGNADLAGRVVRLRAERAAVEHEEAWRAAEARAAGNGPDGPASLAALELLIPRELDRGRRLHLARAAAEALGPAAAAREAMLEVRARAAAEVGAAPDWPAVVEGDELLAASDDGSRDVLVFRARRDLSLLPSPEGDLTRADLLHLLALGPWDGLFHRGALDAALQATAAPLRLDLSRLQVDEGGRAAQWPGVHVTGPRLSFRPRGGAGDWQDLLEGLPRALSALHAPPHRRDPLLGGALGWLLGSLLLERRWLEAHTGVDRRLLTDLRRDLALRRLFSLRTRAAALRVASEVSRGLSGGPWREAYREALTRATGAAWDRVRAARDGDAGEQAEALAAAGAGEWLRLHVLQRYDEDWWRNPRTAEFLAGLLAAGTLPPAEEREAVRPTRAARMLVAVLEGKAGP